LSDFLFAVVGRQLVTLPAAGGLADAAGAALGAVGDILVLVQITRGEGWWQPHTQSLSVNQQSHCSARHVATSPATVRAGGPV